MPDADTIKRFERDQSGVFSKADLQSLLGEPHPAAFVRRIHTLIDRGYLKRFCRGWYVTETFELAVLSQRIAPESYVSFGSVLAARGVVGTSAGTKLIAAKVGPARKYAMSPFRIEHVTLNESLHFGFKNKDGVRVADAEKAVLDTLYFHLRGRKYSFDIYSDLNWSKLNIKRLRSYLSRYQNPKFIAFVEGLINAS